MINKTLLLIGAIGSMFLSPFCGGAWASMTVWTQSSLVKVRPTDPPTGNSIVTLKAARNEFEPFQIIVTAPGQGLDEVDITISDLVSDSQDRIAATKIQAYREAFINVATPSTIEGGPGEWPDALIPRVDEFVGEMRNGFPFSVPAGQNQPVWIDVYVPPGTPAGQYSGTVTVNARGEPNSVIPVQLTVWNFTLPSTSSLHMAYAVDHSKLGPGHFGQAVDDSTRLDLVQKYSKALLLHRISNEYMTFPLVQLLGDQIDWTAFDANVGPFLDGTVLGDRLPGAKLTAIRIQVGGSTQGNVDYYQDWAGHFNQKGWFDRLFSYTCDEPPAGCDWSFIPMLTQALHRADS